MALSDKNLQDIQGIVKDQANKAEGSFVKAKGKNIRSLTVWMKQLKLWL